MAEYKITEAQMDQLGKLADKCDNLIVAARMPIAPTTHVEQLSIGLDEIGNDLRRLYFDVTGEDPWELEG